MICSSTDAIIFQIRQLTSVADPDSLNTKSLNPDPAFQGNPDPRFSEKDTTENLFIFF
jgi:hypothetical protein